MIIKNYRHKIIFDLNERKIEIFYEENKIIGFGVSKYPAKSGSVCHTRKFVSKDTFYNYLYFDINLNAKNFLYILNKIYEENIKNI